MPKAPTDKSVEEVLDRPTERVIGASLVEDPVRLVQAKVVYLGSRRNRHLPMKGSIGVESFDDGEKVEVIKDTGLTPYDFSTHDLRGKPLTASLMPATHPEGHVRGKPFVVCKHPGHLWQFHRLRDPEGNPEFAIIASGRDATLLDEYFLRRARALRVQDEDFNHIRQHATAADAVGAS